MGVRLNDLPPPGQTPQLEKLKVLAVVPGESWKREDVQREYQKVAELKEMAKSKGIYLNMAKQDVIDLLDELEPGVDHSNLSGKALIAAKKKHHTWLPRRKGRF